MRKAIEGFRKKFFIPEPNKIEWGLAILALFLIFTTMFYVDNFGLFLTYFWTNEELFKGMSLDLFGSNQLPYGLMHQWICEIWVLPINLLYHLFQFDINSPFAVLWYKLIIPVFLVFCMKEMNAIAGTLKIEEKNIKCTSLMKWIFRFLLWVFMMW